MSENMEELASQYGWNPEGEKSAEEYIKVALDKFPDQAKKIKQLFRTLDEVKTHMSKSEQRAYERATKELDAQRLQAIQNGDVEEVERIEKQREELAPNMLQDVHPAIAAFEERNQEWLIGESLEELEMQQWVQAHGQLLAKKNLSPEEHMEKLEENLHKKFPSYFNKGEENIKSPTLTSRDNITAKSKPTNKNIGFKDLTDEQKQTARDFEQLGVMTIDQYIKDLKDHGEL